MTSLTDLLEAANPVPATPIHKVNQAWAAFERESLVNRSRRRPRLIAASAVASLASAAALLIGILPGVISTSASAATALRHAASALSSQPLLVAGPGQYLYQSDTIIGACVTQVVTPQYPGGVELWYRGNYTTQKWTAADGSGEVVITPAAGGHWATPENETIWKQAGSPAIGGPCSPSTQLIAPPTSASSYPAMSNLPTDPAALGALIAAGRIRQDGQIGTGESSTNVSAQFDIVNNLLGIASLAQRQELVQVLYNVMANLPGVSIIGHQTDPLGRSGTAIVAPSYDNTSEQFLIDPTTGQLLDIKYVLTTVPTSLANLSGWSVGSVTSDTMFGAMQIAGTLGQSPK